MNKKEPSVAIILLNYNGFRDTIDCIDSINKINYKNYKIIVIDNHSEDDSLKKLKHAKKKNEFVLISAKKNNGFASGNNIGIRYALKHSFDFVLLLNNDTIVTPNFLIYLVNSIKDDFTMASGTILYYSHKNLVWYGGGEVNKITGRVCHHYYNKNKLILPKNNEEINFISGCEMLIPLAIINKIGLLSEDYFLYEEDTDFCIRATKAGANLLYVPNSIIYHKVNATTSKIPGKMNYYLFRNKKILIFKNFYWLCIPIALSYTNFQAFYRLLHGRQSVKCMIMAWIDLYFLGKNSSMIKTIKRRLKNKRVENWKKF